jgi:DNA polymerase I
MSKETLYVIDISGFIHRGFHVHQDLTTSKGLPTGAVYGTISMLCNFIVAHKPTHMVICYDSQDGQSVRKEIYPEYKANRVQVNAVSAQERIIRRIIDLLGIQSTAVSGYEADDLIASVTEKFKREMDIVIVTGDKDMLQLIESGVTVYDPMKDIYYSEQTAKDKFGVAPSQISDYLALVGDKADNIPGVKGIGPKAAQELLGMCVDVEEVIEKLDTLPPKHQEKLRKSLPELEVSKKLATLIKLDLPPTDTTFKPVNSPQLDLIFDKLEFTAATKTRILRFLKPYSS